MDASFEIWIAKKLWLIASLRERGDSVEEIARAIHLPKDWVEYAVKKWDEMK